MDREFWGDWLNIVYTLYTRSTTFDVAAVGIAVIVAVCILLMIAGRRGNG